MKEDNLFEPYIQSAYIAQIFAGLGGDCDEFMQFLQLEWESYAKEFTSEQETRFYNYLKWYNESRKQMVNHDWRNAFDGRNHFGTIV